MAYKNLKHEPDETKLNRLNITSSGPMKKQRYKPWGCTAVRVLKLTQKREDLKTMEFYARCRGFVESKG